MALKDLLTVLFFVLFSIFDLFSTVDSLVILICKSFNKEVIILTPSRCCSTLKEHFLNTSWILYFSVILYRLAKRKPIWSPTCNKMFSPNGRFCVWFIYCSFTKVKIKTSSDILEDRHRMGKCENFERNHNIFLRVFYCNECYENELIQDLGRRAWIKFSWSRIYVL